MNRLTVEDDNSADATWRVGAECVDAILGARHPDPFSVLGPHQTAAGIAIRAVAPRAERMSALTGEGDLIALSPGGGGFFEGLAPGRRGQIRYRLRTETAGKSCEYADAYALGPVLGPMDDHLFVEGAHRQIYERLGAHLMRFEGIDGAHFAVWAPRARRVSVVGDFNGWDGRVHQMRKRIDSGLWEIFIPGVGERAVYKYEILARDGRLLPLKADPIGFSGELRPSTASVVARTDGFTWSDAAFLERRKQADPRRAPMAIYEIHLGSWRRRADGGFLSYDELAESLIPYAAGLGFTHLELLPISEHPLDASWGYQPIGLFAPTSRFGDPAGFARLIDRAHAAGLGVILDWVPAHFPTDAHGLAQFDGEPLYEHADPRRGHHPDWNTAIYDFGRREVTGTLAANALFWFDRYHVDGLRVDAVASMLYLDYSRKPGEWTPNPDGSNDNKDAAAFLRRVNELVYGSHEGAVTVAEESTAWPGVTAPTYAGGLGFGFKWNMGFMHDTLDYMALDPVHRRWHHDKLTFGLLYAFSENYVLALSHDEVVHEKGSLLQKMSGDDWQKFANLRAYYGYMWAHPGKKLLFMGQEFAQRREWSEARELDWDLLQSHAHLGVQTLVRDLNRLHREHGALHARDCEPEGFCWIVADDQAQSVAAFLRFGAPGDRPVVAVANFTPEPRRAYAIGLPRQGKWLEILNTDANIYGGSGMGNLGAVEACGPPLHGQPASASLILPPLATLYLMPAGD